MEIVEVENVTCAGIANGFVEIQATGGVGNFEFSLGNAINTTGIFENLSVGNYTLTVTDGNGCEDNMTFTISSPPEISLEMIEMENVTCAGIANGFIEIQATGGVGNFEFSLGNATNTTGIFENLSAGNYTLTATDANGCENNMTFTISSPSEISLEIIEVENVTCAGGTNGSVEIQAMGGAGNFEFSLGNATNTTGIFENLSAGNYTLTVTDANDCSTEMMIEIAEPSAIIFENVQVQDLDCFGAQNGQIEIIAGGGTGMLTFSLNNQTNTTGTFANLTAGNYEVVITDENGCTTIEPISVTQPPLLESSIDNIINDSGNADGSATINGVGGTPPLTYALDGVNFQTENTFNNLAAGTYTGYIQDANGCISTAAFVIDLETSANDLRLGVMNAEVFPNPFSSDLYLRVELAFSQSFDLKMWTVSGKQVVWQALHLEKGSHQIEISIQNQLPPGIYILELKNKLGGAGYFKLVKQ
ncbi:MAG: T9SS type A sorting domain-containing protein [Bacteroidota bacterium]